MLFKALIERLLGSDEAQDWKERERAKTSRFSYDNYPSLVKILIELRPVAHRWTSMVPRAYFLPSRSCAKPDHREISLRFGAW
jgi:hypothetical protein